MQRVADEWQKSNVKYAGAKVAFTGPPAFVAEAAAGMRRDLTGSVLGTLVFIGLLFWLAYRDWRPLILIVVLLSLIVAVALALGGLFMGTLNVVSLGFAGILLGITADYALVLYQSSLAATQTKSKASVAGGNYWSAFTTAGAFLFLRVSGLSRLAQLGTLAAVQLSSDADWLFFRWRSDSREIIEKFRVFRSSGSTRKAFAVMGTGAVIIFVVAGRPGNSRSLITAAMRCSRSTASLTRRCRRNGA